MRCVVVARGIALALVLCVSFPAASEAATRTTAATSAKSAEQPAPSAAPDITVDEVLDEVDGWTIATSHSLGGCFAGAGFDDDTTLWLGLGGGEDRGFLLATNPGWTQLQLGRSYDVSVNMPGQPRWRGKGIGISRGGEKGILVSDLKDETLGSFARANAIEVSVDNRILVRLPLTASSAAVAQVLRCQVLYARVREEGPPKDETHPSTGTGFFVSWRGLILTNHHVVDGCKVLEVRRAGAEPVPARLVADDAANDLALIQTSLRTRHIPSLVTRARTGQAVYVYGFPLQDNLTSTGNFTSGSVTAVAGVGDDTSRLQISAPIQPGNSGGPVLDQNGNILGAVVSTYVGQKRAPGPVPQNVNFAIKAAAVATFLEAHGVEPRIAVESARLEPTEIAEKAREFTVRVECDVPH
ncbi:MAG: hypothetical protein B7Z15_09195 [Rhizobiales bacterium 32-66-8]|nr:MAG: hypothetical protein B7Z15_09195 [Rhizobiales bacterium 32-66-8]